MEALSKAPSLLTRPPMNGQLPIYPMALVQHGTPTMLRKSWTHKQENSYRRKVVNYMHRILCALPASIAVEATAITYFHHFYMHYSFDEFDYHILAISFIFLAGKVEEQRIDIVQVARQAYAVMKGPDALKSVSSSELRRIEYKALDFEILVLQTIRFCLRPLHPYGPCVDFLTKIRRAGQARGFPEITSTLFTRFLQYTWWLIGLSLRSHACLTHSPEDIALVCLELATKFPQPEPQEPCKFPENWLDMFTDDVGAARKRFAEIENLIADQIDQCDKHGYSMNSATSEEMGMLEASKFIKMRSMQSTAGDSRSVAPSTQAEEKHSERTLKKPRHESPSRDRRRYSPERKRHSLDRNRHSSERKRYSPERRRYSPNSKRYSPERRRYTPDSRRRSPERKRY